MTVTVEAPPYRMFAVRLTRRERRSPSLVRLTFTDASLAEFADRGFDQRIKLVLPQAGGLPLADFPTGEDWWSVWRDQPLETRAHIRTYTVAELRPEAGEIDLDFVDHGVTGPGSRFAIDAQQGDEAIIFGPNAAFRGEPGGLEFRREFAATSRQLVVGDLTALPAINGIASRLPVDATGLICVTVPHAEDATGIVPPPGVDLVWCVEDRDEDQAEAVRQWLSSVGPLGADDGQTTVVYDGSDDAYWEVSDAGRSDSTTPALSAWIAGESSQVRTLRRMLVDDFSVPRSAVCFMGYWRIGVSGS